MQFFEKMPAVLKNLSLLLFIIAGIITLFPPALPGQTQVDCPLQPFGEIEVDPQFELNGKGENVDTIEFWEADDPANTLLFVSAKDNRLVEIWKYPFVDNEQSPLEHLTFTGNVNGLVVDQEEDLLYVSIAGDNPKISVFTLPNLEFVMSFIKPDLKADLGIEPNLTMIKLLSGEKRIYLSSEDSVYIHDAKNGTYLDQFKPSPELETLFADNFYQRIYIPDESDQNGVYVYNPDGSPYLEKGSNNFGYDDIFQSDAEGIWLYTCPADGLSDNGSGFIIVSDQIDEQSEFEVFDRESWDHLGTVKISGVSNTDGIRSFQKSLPDYPLGLFVAIDDDNAVVGVGWDVIFNDIAGLVSIEETNTQPHTTFLGPSYPNPFNPTTKINYTIQTTAQSYVNVQLTIYDVRGRKVSELINKPHRNGDYEIVFDASGLCSGVYYYQLVAGTVKQTRKMIFLQ